MGCQLMAVLFKLGSKCINFYERDPSFEQNFYQFVTIELHIFWESRPFDGVVFGHKLSNILILLFVLLQSSFKLQVLLRANMFFQRTLFL